MKLMQLFGGLVIVALASGCGPRLRRPADAPAGAAVDVPVARMVVNHDASKLDAEHKYKEAGQFTVGGIFYKDAEAKDATVKVSLQPVEGGVARSYALDLAELAGTSAKIEMWDDGFLTVVIPEGDAPTPGFQTSNTNIKAVSLEVPGLPASTCYFAKEVLDGQIRLALCELQTPTPRLTFVDAIPEAAPAAAPSTEPGAAPAPAPAPAH